MSTKPREQPDVSPCICKFTPHCNLLFQASRRRPPDPGEPLCPAEPVPRDVPGGVPRHGGEERLEAERTGRLADHAAHGERLVDQGNYIYLITRGESLY